MKEEKFRKLIRRYLNNECTLEEKAEVESWYASLEDDADLLAFLSGGEKDRLRSIIFEGIRNNISAREAATLREKKRIPLYYIVTGAAALIVLAFGLNWLLNLSQSREAASLNEETKQVTRQNLEKNIKRVILPDSSTAWLHPNSSLTYPEHFTTPERTVSMTGEVFFDVKPDSTTPFIVYSGTLQTKVLGTSFRIRAYNNDPFAKVSVMTGRVSVKHIPAASPGNQDKTLPDSGNEIVLLPDESVLFSEAQPVLKKEKTLKGDEMAMWRKTNLTFSNVPVQDVLRKLNTVYDVRIKVSEQEINDYLLKADFTGMNLPDVLEMLSLSLGLSYELDQDTIVLKISKP